MLRVYQDQLVGEVPQFPREIEDGIDRYLAMPALPVETLTAELSVAPVQTVSPAAVRWSGPGPSSPAKPQLDGGRDRATSEPAIIDAVRPQPSPIELAPPDQGDPEEQPEVSSPPVEREPEAIEQESAAPVPDPTR